MPGNRLIPICTRETELVHLSEPLCCWRKGFGPKCWPKGFVRQNVNCGTVHGGGAGQEVR